MVDYPNVRCEGCTEIDCRLELEEVNGLPYRKCLQVGRKPVVLEDNSNIWAFFQMLINNHFFIHFSFFLRDMIKSLGIHFTESGLLRLSYLYNRYCMESRTKGDAIPLALLRMLCNG